MQAAIKAADVKGQDAPASEMPSAKSSLPVKPKSKGAHFHKHVGIQELGTVQRKCKCYFCEAALEKGSVKFVYAFHTAKPARSIHTGCVFSMSELAAKNSLDTLQGLLASGSVNADAKAICKKALSVLQPIAGAAPA